jgi:hypothetical protein
MRRIGAAFCVVLGTLSVACAQEPSATSGSFSVTAASEFRYYSWRSDRGFPTTFGTQPGHGFELYAPLALQLVGKPTEYFKTEFLIRGGWVHAHQSTAGMTGTVDTITDTVMSATLTYLGINGLQPFASLSLNIPTGKSSLSGSAAFARMDPDLVEIASFGEGWNIGPTIGANLPLSPTMIVTGSVGYTSRAPFSRERSTDETDPTQQSPTRVNPGDVITGTLSINYKGAPWAWSLAGTISEETATTENGSALYRAGRRYLGTGSLSYSWPAKWGQTTLRASATHSNRNDVLFLGAAELIKEIFNTNSDLFRIGLEHLFPVSETLVIGPTASFLHRNHNGYNFETLQFVPAKDRWSAGLLARAAATQNITLNLRAEYVRTREDERFALNGQVFSVLANAFVPGSAVPVTSSDGFLLAGGLNVKF